MSTLRFSLLLAAGCVVLAFMPGCPNPHPFQPLEFTSANTAGRDVDLAPGGLDDGTGGETDGEGAGGSPNREVVEPDVIRQAGDLLYVLNQYRGLSIVDLAGETMLAQVPTYGYPRDLYLVGDRAYVLVAFASNIAAEDGVIGYGAGTRLYVVDISDPAAAAVESTFELDGDLIDSRLVGDVLYAVSAQFSYGGGGGGMVEGDDGVAVGVSNRKQTSSSWVSSVFVGNPDAITVVDTLSFEGYGNVIQATNTAIFVSGTDWATGDSTVTYVDISDPAGAIAARGSVEIPGYIADRFKMDVYSGVLRVVSGNSWPARDVYVTTVDLADPDALAVLGNTTIPDAAGETLFATRFDGPRAYVVTYFMVDPLFVVDLSDPANPVVAGQLEIPGWSTHIEPRGDRLIALGVDDTGGSRRVKVSLFDVADPATPAELDVVSFGGDWSWSNAYSDVKAFTVLDDTLIVPFSGWTYGEGGFERLQFISYTLDDLTLRGSVDLQGQTLRSFRTDENYYGVTTEQVAVIDGSDLDHPEVINAITLAEYVADYQELSADARVAVVSHYESNSTTVRTVGAADGATLSEILLDFSYVIASELHGDDLVVVTSGYDTRGFYRVVIIDCSDPALLSIASDTRVDVEPYWGGYWYGGPIGVDDGVAEGDGDSSEGSPGEPRATNKQQDIAIWYPWWNPGKAALIAGDTLALRCVATDYDQVFGGETEPREGLALLDLDSGALNSVVGLGFDWLDSVNAAGDHLYLGTRRDLGTDLLRRPICAFYVYEFSPGIPAIGPGVNVPGRFVQYDPASNVLLLEDTQYENFQQVRRELNSVSWDGGERLTVIDSLEVSGNIGDLMPRGNQVYFSTYSSSFGIGRILVSGGGALSNGGEVSIGEGWGYLLDASGDTAYAVLGGSSIAIYDFSASPPVLSQVVSVMSAPIHVRFGEAAAYATLGYAGVAELPL